MVRVYVRDAEVGKRGSVHLFRHTMATLMLEGGADVRYVQAMLGHSRLETTALYTQVAAKKLREVHARSHPAGLRSAP
jgi:integrase/recombinase XerD